MHFISTYPSISLDKMSNPTSSEEQNRLPKDGIVVQTMLQEMGITNYEPKLIPMVLDFMHRSLK